MRSRLRFIYNFLVFVAFIAMVSSCDNNRAAREAEVRDSLTQYYTLVKDSIDSTWTIMMHEDDMKLGLMKHLLEEITNTNDYDEEAVNSLMSRVDDVKAMRYDQVSMGNQELIDQYDFAINSLIKEISVLARSNPQYQNFPRMAELLDNIQYIDNRVLFHRVHYDYFAKDYNKIIHDHPDLVKEIDPKDPQVDINIFEIRNE